MKSRNALAVCLAAWALTFTAVAQPLARISISSFGEVSNAVARLARTVSPGSQTDVVAVLTKKLGLTNMATFEAQAPWELAVWQENGSNAPLVAIKGPIADVKKFKGELDPAGLLAHQGKDWAQLGEKSAVIVFKAADRQTEGEKAALKSWESEPISPPHRALLVALTPDESTKERVLPFLAMARMSFPQMAAAGSPNPKAMAQLFNLYFDGIEGFVKGLQSFSLGAAVDADSLQLEESVSAVPGTPLAQWIHKPANPVKAEDLKGVQQDALFSGAISLGKDAALMDVLRKFMKASLEMQNQGTNDTSLNDMMALVEMCLPTRFSGSVFMQDKLEFTGAYRFPGSDAATLYPQMRQVMAQLVKTQAGQGKMYSAASLTEKHHLVDDVPVDRLSFTMNLDNPIFQAPGQKEQIKALWADGKLEFDYAVKDGQLFLASPGLMKTLFEQQTAAAMTPDDSTVALGYLNILSAVRFATTTNPGIPEAVKERMRRLELKGTAIQFQLREDTQVRCEQRIPLKLLEQIAHLKGAS